MVPLLRKARSGHSRVAKTYGVLDVSGPSGVEMGLAESGECASTVGRNVLMGGVPLLLLTGIRLLCKRSLGADLSDAWLG